MATVRIYKVAEALNITSQEVVALLKTDHGIEVKSASSTIEEVVARSFVERQARQRNIPVPSVAQMFSDAPVAKSRKGGKAVEPPKPAAAPLPPPRLIKVVHRPAPPVEPVAEGEEYLGDGVIGEAPGEAPFATDVAPAESQAAATMATPARPRIVPPRATGIRLEENQGVTPPPAEPIEIEARGAPAVDDTVTAAPEAPTAPAGDPAARISDDAVAAAPTAPAPAAPSPAPATAAPAAAAAAAATPAARTPAGTPVGVAHPGVAQPGATRPAARPAAPGAPGPARPAIRPQPTGRVVPPTMRLRVESPGSLARPPLGGPRPVPSQPVRPGQSPTGIRSPLTTVRPSYAPTGYVAPSRPAPPAPQQPARPHQPQHRPQGRPAGRKSQSERQRDRDRLQTIQQQQAAAGPPPVTKLITLAEGMTVKDLADKLEVKAKDVLKKLIEKRMMLTINSTLDTETAAMIAREFGAEIEMRSFEEELVEAETETVDKADLVTRAPVVTVMGHVDHGKTTLLDAIRLTRVAEREAGGITQHIGAYAVDVNKRKVVFLDTPGHEAFTMMRARGARVTDVVILVVAADDGVMPQTREAINHAKAAGVPIIVAINKIDKPEANPDLVKKELSELGLVPEDWGGTTVTVAVSAKKREGLDLLLEMILLVTEIGDFKANPKRNATGTVLEAKLDRGRGPVATVLVQDGTLAVGDNFIAGTIVGKVRALIDDRGRATKAAGPSTPVEVLGLGGVPQPGDTFQSIADAAKARQIALFRQNQAKEKKLGGRGGRLTLETLKQHIAEGAIKELPIVIKADVQGSAEVLADTLTKLSNENVEIKVVSAGVGAINESDVLLASASNAIVIGFNVRPDRNAAEIAEREHVDLRLHSVIYNVTDEIKKAMEGMLEPTFKEVRLGAAEVRQVFKVPKFGTVAGCMVTDGLIRRSGGAQARLLRDNVVVYEGTIGSLKRFKDDVGEVKAGFECGIGFERYNDLKMGDVIEAFVIEQIAATAS